MTWSVVLTREALAGDFLRALCHIANLHVFRFTEWSLYPHIDLYCDILGHIHF